MSFGVLTLAHRTAIAVNGFDMIVKAEHPWLTFNVEGETDHETMLTKEETVRTSLHRYRNIYGWLTEVELRVLEHALENYIKLGPDNSVPIMVARDLLKGIIR